MTDQELADKVVAFGVGGKAEASGWYYVPFDENEAETYAELHYGYFVRDWRVAGALIEKVDLLKDFRQMVLEVSHAYECGLGWYTKGENGLRQQVYRWTERARKSLDIDLQDPRAITEACCEALS